MLQSYVQASKPRISTASEDIEFPGIGMAIIVDCSRIDAAIEIVQRSSIWLIVNFEDDLVQNDSLEFFL